MKVKVTIAAIILGLVVPIILFVGAIEAAVFDKAFYMAQMEKNQVIENTGIYPPDIDLVVAEILSYLRNERESFDIQARIAPPEAKGVTETEIIFNEKEISHMIDVRDLLIYALGVRDLCIFLFLISFLYLLKVKKELIIKSLFWGNLSAVVLFFLLAMAFIFNFQEIFILFHRVFFTNELWILDPTKDLLINIVPEPFFMALISRMIAYLATFFILIIGGTGFYLYWKRGKHENIKH